MWFRVVQHLQIPQLPFLVPLAPLPLLSQAPSQSMSLQRSSISSNMGRQKQLEQEQQQKQVLSLVDITGHPAVDHPVAVQVLHQFHHLEL
mmetsp:Transcript_100271/g.321555  ORF Transcript_100271/g.321555 Transcript_100271/m.321555 type:complete len:90 (-) Transcript_100271:762-1031(-)